LSPCRLPLELDAPVVSLLGAEPERKRGRGGEGERERERERTNAIAGEHCTGVARTIVYERKEVVTPTGCCELCLSSNRIGLSSPV
jgi:hypothetical protein